MRYSMIIPLQFFSGFGIIPIFTVCFQVEPEQSEVHDEMKKRGLKASNIHTQEDELKMMQMIRAVPRPIPIKQSMK